MSIIGAKCRSRSKEGQDKLGAGRSSFGGSTCDRAALELDRNPSFPAACWKQTFTFLTILNLYFCTDETVVSDEKFSLSENNQLALLLANE